LSIVGSQTLWDIIYRINGIMDHFLSLCKLKYHVFVKDADMHRFDATKMKQRTLWSDRILERIKKYNMISRE
jgi:hypothetical protein